MEAERIADYAAEVISPLLPDVRIFHRDESGWVPTAVEGSQIIDSVKDHSRVFYIHAAADLYGAPTLAQLVRENLRAEKDAAPVLCFSSRHDYQQHRLQASPEQNSVPCGYVPLPVAEIAQSSCQGPVLLCARLVQEDQARLQLRVLRSMTSLLPEIVWFVSPEEQKLAQNLLESEEMEGVVTVIAQRSPARFRELLASASLFVHLRFSAICPTGPYLPLALAAGVPTIVFDFGETAYLPDVVTRKILPGYSASEELSAVLRELFVGHNSAAVRSAMAESSRKFASELHSASVVAQALTYWGSRATSG